MSIFNQPNIKPNEQRLFWTGKSGEQYQLYNHPIGTVYLPVAGVYIFCKALPDGRFQAVYVGETDNFRRRITDELAAHHCWDRVIACGATHISTLRVEGGNAERVRIETDLRHGLNPSCNLQ
jgi:hypothetical protein